MKRKSYYALGLYEASKREPNFKKAFEYLTKAHDSGDLAATYAIGTWYLHGRYVKKSISKGLRYVRLAAQGNVPEALFDLAVAFETGELHRKSLRNAAQCYLSAALLGDKHAMHEVGRCFYHGIGFNKDRNAAKVFYNYGVMLDKDYTREHGSSQTIEDRRSGTSRSKRKKSG